MGEKKLPLRDISGLKIHRSKGKVKLWLTCGFFDQRDLPEVIVFRQHREKNVFLLAIHSVLRCRFEHAWTRKKYGKMREEETDIRLRL